MAPPTWKLLVDFGQGSQFSSRLLDSTVCPCRYCWSEKCARKSSLQVSDLYSILGVGSPICRNPKNPPKWKLLLIFEDGSELSSRLLQCEICPCSYCWCGQQGSKRLQLSDFGAFQKFLSPKAVDSLNELLSRSKSFEIDISAIKIETECSQVATKQKVTRAKKKEENGLGDGTPNQDSGTSCQIKESPRRRSNRISRKKASQPQDPLESPKYQDKQPDHDHEIKSETLTPAQEVDEKCPAPEPEAEASEDIPASLRTSSHVDMIDTSVNQNEQKPPELEEPEKQMPNSDHQPHVQKPVKGIRCHECQKWFQKRIDLDHHLIEHDPYPFKCFLCPLRFETRKENSVHMRTHAAKTGERPHQCNQCPQSFNRLHHLKAHMLLHSGERPFKCDHCSLTFNHSGSLSSHLALHRKEQFKCFQCSESFLRPKHLRDHMRIVHSGSGEQPAVQGQE